MRLVSDQRAGAGADADAVADADAGAGAGALVVAVAAGGAVAGSGVCEGMVTDGVVARQRQEKGTVHAA